MTVCSATINTREDLRSFPLSKYDDKPLLVFVYMTGCPYCEIMKPEWKKLEAAKVIDTIESHYMLLDTLKAIFSPVSTVNPNGYPHIQLIKPKSKQVIQYEGIRDKEHFIDFVKKHIKSPLPKKPSPDKKDASKKKKDASKKKKDASKKDASKKKDAVKK